MENPFERGPHKNIERTITCPICNNDQKIEKTVIVVTVKDLLKLKINEV